VALAAPILPLYLVHVVKATDADVGIINMTFTSHAGRLPALAASLAPARWSLCAAGHHVGHGALPAPDRHHPFCHADHHLYRHCRLFQGGLDLVFFDEYMKTIPDEYSAILVSLEQSIQYLSVIAAR